MTSLQLFTGLFRRFRAKVLGSPVRVVGQCRMCGSCCADILILYKGKWLRRKRDCEAMVRELPGYSRFECVGRNPDGFLTFTCRSLGEDKFCTSYEERPSLCRNYPSKSLYYQGGWLRPDCGYSFRAETFRQAIRRLLTGRDDFSKVLEEQLRKGGDKEPSKKDTES
ncbi:YkgJ family cysteine cluster protein [Pseudodesulfovibrio portus]|uniref:YkgJ family cysteine cluster protein n=1 Tax=Pseudodesulfovibrio portus TaxID=231439 RepID=A0ABM8ARJ5_9BACT|nr:YkgJ family cysteine cluster protein [Pseudodesulfovibrio portus]BDQ33936.1 hypothetical protein JCM14722_14780 [Pseudodesulfovibrio portus]